MAGFFQRAWMQIASAVYSKDELAILKACQTGEEWSRSVYEDAVDVELPTKVRDEVEAQFAKVVQVQAASKRYDYDLSLTLLLTDSVGWQHPLNQS